MSREYKTVDIDPGGNFVGKKYPCILTSELKEYVKYPFEHFNPVQSNFIHFLEDDERNVVVASETSSGKTVCAELFAARAIQQGKKVLYIAPMKALADEKFSDWTDTDHSFGSMSIEIMTGDFKTTDVKKQKLHMADIIILTPEMFNSKCRQTNSNKWLKNSVLIVDEIHLVGLDGRGSAEEVGIVQYYENFPDARALFLSATLPNVDEFGKWISNLTGRPTEVIVSDYRPCNLSIHFVGFPKAKDYASTETRRMEKVLEYIDNKKDEPMIVFVGSKAFGRKLSTYLNELKIDHCFHNADLNRETTTIEIVIDGKKTIKKVKGRKQIEEEFRSLNFNVLIATTTVAWGCNSAARNVLQCHTKIGPKPLHPADIRQAVGRAGRLGYANKGDAYIFAPSSELVKERTRIFSDYKIESTLNKIDTLAFHILSYVVDGTIRTKEDFTKWYEKTLAFVQAGTIGEERAEKILGALSRRHMIKKSEDQYFPTKLGGITSRMYMCPFTVYDWFINFSKIKHLHPSKDSPENAQRIINLEVAKALSESYLYGRTHSFDSSGGLSKKDLTGEHYISVDERATEEVKEVCHLLNQQPKPFHKHMAIFFRKLNGETLSPRLNSYSIGVEKDIDRIVATMEQCDSIFGIKAKKKYNLKGYGWGKEWGLLASRIKLGVPMEIIELVEVPGIGRQRAFKLRDIGIKTQEDLSNPKYFNLCQKTIGKKTYEKALDWCKITKL